MRGDSRGESRSPRRLTIRDRETIVRARIANHGERPGPSRCRIGSTSPLASDRSAPARFFKHGYQSWSGSGAAAVGAASAHRNDTAHAIVRINHQSETTRPADAPEAATSELFTIVECDGRPERALAGFIGAAHALTTLTVRAPESDCGARDPGRN